MKTSLESIRKEISKCPGIGRSRIAEKTGLDIRTVSANIRKLLKQGVIIAAKDRKRRVGRTGCVYFPTDEDKLCFAGIYLDLSRIICVFKDIHGDIIDTRTETFSLDFASLHHTARRVCKIISAFTKQRSLKVTSIGLTMRERRGDKFAEGAKRLISLYTELPVFYSSPIDAFAWSLRMHNLEAEKILTVHFGAVQIEISLTESLFQDNEAAKFAKRLSHTTVEKSGPPCYCGKNGCLEYYVHGFAIREELREIKGIEQDEYIDLSALCRSGDSDTLRIVEKAEKHIAWALKKTIRKFKPDLVYLIIFENESIQKEMKNVINGSWIPANMKNPPEFRIYDIMTNPGAACAEAIADKAIMMNGKSPK